MVRHDNEIAASYVVGDLVPQYSGLTGAMIRRRVVAHGRVQGVFFRDTCRREARAHRVAGWVTNREDGAVEAVFEGEPRAVQALVEWARHGPPQAQVTQLEVIEEKPCGERGFSVR